LGTRPEIIKLSDLIEGLDKNFQHEVIHTGQHYDPEMDRDIFKALKLKYPKHRLNISQGSFSEQFSSMLISLEKIFTKLKPDFVLVQGDTNSAMGAALVAARLKIKVIHIEAGCRSGNLNAPEEQNRLLIDAIATLRFASDKHSQKNLQTEGKSKGTFYSGSSTFDAIKRSSEISRNLRSAYKFPEESYVMVTLHRAENLDAEKDFLKKIELLNWLADKTQVVFPIHPRTKKYLKEKKISLNDKIVMTAPLNPVEFTQLLKNCRLVLSDSGGIQEEAAFFDRPCLVLRNETEWMRLIKAGKNFLLARLNQADYKLVSRLLTDDKFYKSVRKKKSPEIKAGSTKKIIDVLKKVHKST
jgi:UDP-N-acetylglucosamine 2-epimerase